MDTVSAATRSKIMSKIRSKHTKPERLFRRLLRKEKIRYRLHYGAEKIDIALTQNKVAIFIDGCFWHQCPKHSHLPKTNRGYWIPKLKKNKLRAKEKDKRLKKGGWIPVHIWEHELKKGKLSRKNRKMGFLKD